MLLKIIMFITQNDKILRTHHLNAFIIKIILGHSAHVVYGFRVRAPDPAPAHHRPADPAQGDCRERKVGDWGRGESQG